MEKIYEFRDGLRTVRPYEHTFRTHVKERWRGQKLITVLVKEFDAYTEDYFRTAIECGKIRINGRLATPDTVLHGNQLFEHQTIIHEPPVHDRAVTLCGRAEFAGGFLYAVNKPCGLPVHPGAAYRQNSLLSIIQNRSRLKYLDCCADGAGGEDGPGGGGGVNRECKFLQDFPAERISAVHRLDRLTSGLVALTADRAVAQRCEQIFREGAARKLYLARVAGDAAKALQETCADGGEKFHQHADGPLDGPLYQPASGGPAASGGQPGVFELASKVFEVRGFVSPVNRKRGVQEHTWLPTGRESKSASTLIKVLATAAGESLVLLRPLTGRTHQLRVALKAVGCPISNDPNYGPTPCLHSTWIPATPHVSLEGDAKSPSSPHHHTAGIFLHAWRLELPSDEEDSSYVRFEAPVPDWCWLGNDDPTEVPPPADWAEAALLLTGHVGELKNR